GGGGAAAAPRAGGVVARGKTKVPGGPPGSTRPVRRFGAAEERADCLALSPDGRTLAAGNGRGITLWELASGREVLRIKGELIAAIAFAPDGRRLVSATSYRKTCLWDTATGGLVREF